jgi:hypothetical protein
VGSRRRRPERRRLAGDTRSRVSGDDSGWDLVGEIEDVVGNPIREERGRGGGRRRRPAARGGGEPLGAPSGHGRSGGEGKKTGGRASSPPRGAPGTVDRRRAAAERRRGGGPELERQWRLGARV